MALQSFPWVNDAYMAQWPPLAIAPTFVSVTCDASADRVVYAGRFVHKDRGTKTVDGVGFLFGTVTKSAGSTFKVSLQDVSLTAGPPMREDGTQDQTLSIANADAGFASNAWYEAGFDSSATRSLTHGDLIAVVFQFDTFVSADTVNIRAVSAVQATMVEGQSIVVANLTGAYAQQTAVPNVVLRCNDGSYGTLQGAVVCSAINTHTFTVNTAGADEYALAFQYPVPVKIDGFWILANAGTATDTSELLLYSGTTALVTMTLDHNAIRAATSWYSTAHTEQTLAANTLYRIAFRPTGGNNVSVYSIDVNMANHLQCHPGGVNAHVWTRVDQGAWGGELTTRRLFAGVRPSAWDDAVSVIKPGGTGMFRHMAVTIR